MSHNLADRFRRWFDYERDVHQLTLESLSAVPVEGQTRLEFRRAVSLMGHIIAARRLWLSRIAAEYPRPTVLFPENVSLEAVAAESNHAESDWEKYLTTSDDNELQRDVEYRSTDGGRFCSRVEDILAQLFTHSAYHRGQIAMLVRQVGGQPAMTDFIFWSRTTLPPETA
ncbi:MAG: DinB family protein [Gemmataceae bacterium]|nr:DinB family protein [Gemmataceae bacterium]